MPRVSASKYVTYYGIDGEGRGRREHKYTLLAAASTKGHRLYAENPGGLSSIDCFEFILRMPKHAMLFSYAFNYDITKIVEDLPAASIYYLMRPELRQSPAGMWPVIWNGYHLDYLGTRFSVKKKGKRVEVWDIWKFYQGKFTKALDDWKVGDPKIIAEIKAMKEKRGHFDKVSPKRVKEYCFSECTYIAELAERLTETHEDIGLHLTSYYGPGSTATAMLDKMGIKEKRRLPSEQMEHAVACAFFGGRFEVSAIGPIEGLIYNYDISSAYPYQMCLLPCLEHGQWKHVTKRKQIDKARAAVIRYSLGKPRRSKCWGPFPFRLNDGTVVFPEQSGGGWVWKDEFLAAEKLFENVGFEEAWILESDCDCLSPLGSIAGYYLERVRVGKDAKGIVLKLAYNSGYGKLAQSVGAPKFQCWIWAGMITSGCRAQILEMLGRHKDWRNLLMIATDGIYTREKIDVPKPKETGANDCAKPLGGWEESTQEKGIFIARPGILFPLNPTEEEIKKVRARGLGRGVLFDNWKRIVDSWNENGATKDIESTVIRFMGAKTAIHRTIHEDGENYFRSKNYGRWIEQKVKLSLSPLPKRDVMLDDGTLTLRSFPGQFSHPYTRALYNPDLAPEVLDIDQSLVYSTHIEEQPDLDF